MDISSEILALIGRRESNQLEFKATLPPALTLGKVICSLANSEGGYIVLGVPESGNITEGLSSDFNASQVTNRAIEMIYPRPDVKHQYVLYNGKPLYGIKVSTTGTQYQIQNKAYTRLQGKTVVLNPVVTTFAESGYRPIAQVHERLESLRSSSTSAKIKFIDHYLGVLKILDDSKTVLYPVSPVTPTNVPEGQILMRILFSSCADNFEIYLSELLYEIYLAKPETLKSEQQISVREVLNCSDIQEFVAYYAKKRLGNLERGSVKGFISDNRQIRDLAVLDETKQNELERIMQIRHLYAHKNGIVDEKFQKYYPGQYTLNQTHQLSVDDMLAKISYLFDQMNDIDGAAIVKYQLGALD